jgi:uncharacterized protein (DUF983 family)
MSVPIVPNVVPIIPIEKTCSKCNETKVANKFPKDRNVCKDCGNAISKEKRRIIREETLKNTVVVIVTEKCCIVCNQTKIIKKFLKSKNLCKDCNYNIKLKKHKEKKCNVCNNIQPSSNFRIDRLKCIDCERKHGNEYRKSSIGKQKTLNWLNYHKKNDPVFKFLNNQRKRILNTLKKYKSLHTIEYLDCNGVEYFEWLKTHFNETINFENHNTVWHIDHVIPISTFNFQEDNVTELAKIAFNWRNTMPLLKEHNLSKNNKIDREQIEQHLTHLTEYHKKHHKEIPHEFIDLFAKHLVDGKSLKV